MLVFLLKTTLLWLARSFIFSKLILKFRNYMVKKYNLEAKFNQSYDTNHSVDWRNVYWFAELARYIYKSDNDLIRKKFSSFDEIYINEINEIKYMLLTDHTNKKQYISVRGTNNSHNALQDINFLKDPSFRLGIDLHTGFHRTAEKIADDLLYKLITGYEINVTGHSLGGAVAVIVSWYIDYAHYSIGECITYGQPKVTDAIGSRKMRGKINITRIVNETDVVPLVPPAGTHITHRYTHLGKLIKILPNGKYCYLEEPDSLNFGINSFWMFAAREGFNFYQVGKELPDHYMTSYFDNLDSIITDGEEVEWNDRLQYLPKHDILKEKPDHDSGDDT